MDFSLTSEQSLLRDSLQRFLREEYSFEHRKRFLSLPDGFSRENWKTFAELGWLSAGLSEDNGGWGGGPIETAIIMEEMGRALVVEPFLETAIMSARLIEAAASSETASQVLAAIGAGELVVTCALHEVGRDPELSRCDTVAVGQSDGSYRISGRKIHVTLGGAADRLIVLAKIASPSGARSGKALFLVDAGSAGIERQCYETIDSRQAADIVFDGVAVPAMDMLLSPGEAEAALARSSDHAVAALCAESVGCMDAMIEMTAGYLGERKQFGKPLSGFQVLQHRMAEMFIEADFARSMTYQALSALDEDGAARQRSVSAAKVRVDAASHFVAGNAVHNHGGIGITEEYPVGHFYRRLFVIRQSFGGPDFHLRRLAMRGAA